MFVLAQIKKNPPKRNAVQLTLKFQEVSTCVGGSNEYAIPEKGFRSPHVHRFSEAPIPVNV
ncbi:hypothetical protein CIT292_09517 [Citrobacter youngae ATCC 29220]|uniref:WIF domain-containing protein n=1 Tax=Citrobacter youngae ATCC 29220 TaxID=500640 RepID=D4BG71_9ENTR|nr:hypothetical protein CIT292_09517 [Citrobacter youngae ATCC 29220]